MDKQIIAVILSFILYILFVLLPMIPAILIYKIFPETKVTATGVLAKVNFKTTGAFAAYVVTVCIGFFVVKNTHQQIVQMCCPVWTIKGNVKLLNEDHSTYTNQNILETLIVSIDPELQTKKGGNVILTLPGNRNDWDKTFLKFEIPDYGYEIVDLGNVSKRSKIDNYNLLLTLNDTIKILPDTNVKKEYIASNAELLSPNNTIGPYIH